MPNFHTLKRYSHRSAPKKLIPAIIACKFVPYLFIIGLVIGFSGLIPILLLNLNDDNNVESKEINETSTATEEHSNQFIDDSEESIGYRDYDFISYSCFGIGFLLILTGIICLFIAYYHFKNYQNERIRNIHEQVGDLDSDQTPPMLTDPIIDGIGHPITLLNKSKQSQYFPISQNNNIVYNSTTVPIK